MSVEIVWDRVASLSVMIGDPQRFGDEKVIALASSLVPQLRALHQDLLQKGGDEVLLDGLDSLVRTVSELANPPSTSFFLPWEDASERLQKMWPGLHHLYRNWQQPRFGCDQACEKACCSCSH